MKTQAAAAIIFGIFWIIVTVVVVIACLSGCSSTGFEKQATLMPDSIGIAVGAWQYTPDGHYCPGATVNATWNLK